MRPPASSGSLQRPIRKRNAELPREAVDATAHAIGIAAVLYFLIKFSRGRVIAFDLDEAVSFEGETGPYIQYAVVRANKIFKKLEDREGTAIETMVEGLDGTPADGEIRASEWQ